jgi:hypothetical protein
MQPRSPKAGSQKPFAAAAAAALAFRERAAPIQFSKELQRQVSMRQDQCVLTLVNASILTLVNHLETTCVAQPLPGSCRLARLARSPINPMCWVCWLSEPADSIHQAARQRPSPTTPFLLPMPDNAAVAASELRQARAILQVIELAQSGTVAFKMPKLGYAEAE